ncbi:transporter substrate-binding domain-containing protein [Bradyrhizobium genosp. L]|uniref:transporter substrate-binding domain-containing protein n=1 Tax=Bradyrhizobium genosp. L TaxID=83637 RepID=UPI0018A2D301|nr:transporter substrate-binding domain-containing protein [Bradyrhizobium genosp. L]QPF83900.1 transporter substrate-binding domain-containing protein [Bradyrhizobium genosp. L]
MKVRIAYIEEPPFYWTGDDGRPTGADIELAKVVMRAIGASDIEYHRTSFAEFLPGVQEARWDMNVPIFITAERGRQVDFSVPVWTIGDGFLVRSGNPKALTSYGAVAARGDVRLGLIAAQVQVDSAKAAGVRDDQIVLFKDQPEAIAAMLVGRIDAFAGTALGNRTAASANPALDSVDVDVGKSAAELIGGFSFSKGNPGLLQAVNAELRRYLGTPDHRARVAKYGFTPAEIDGVIAKMAPEA